MLFEPSFGGLRGNVCNQSIARYKARSRLPIRHNWTFFAISYGWDAISGNVSKSARFEGQLWAQISDGRGVAHQPMLVSENWSDCPSCGITISVVDCLVLSQCTRVPDRRSDGQNYDFQDRASIAASRGKSSFKRGALLQCKSLLTPLAVFYVPLSKCGATSGADGHGAMQLSNRNLKYTIDFGALPKLGGTPMQMMPPPSQNPKCSNWRISERLTLQHYGSDS